MSSVTDEGFPHADEPQRLTLLAHYEGAEQLPGMRRRTWYRLYALGWWRGTWTDECARRMARHLTHRADERGRLTDIQAVMASYATVHGVTERVAWNDFRRLRQAGLVRQVVAAAPGRPARYVLSVPADLPAKLPRSLAETVREEIDPLADRLRGRQTRVTVEAAMSQCEVVRYGSAAGDAITTQAGCGRLQSSPYTREGSPPSPSEQAGSTVTAEHEHRSGGITDHEKADALYVVERCGSHWRRRGPGGRLTAAERAALVPLVALLLRHVESADVVELLTERTASAGRLAAVVRYRLGRELAAARRRAQVPADEDGRGYAAAMATRAAAAEERYQQTRTGRSAFAAARAELAERQRRRLAEASASTRRTA